MTMPLSTSSSPTIWKIGRRRATSTKNPTSNGGKAHRDERSRCSTNQVREHVGGGEGEQDQGGGNDERSGDVHQRASLALVASTRPDAPQQCGDEHAP